MYPRSMVLVSSGMQDTYRKYGDLVVFKVVHGLLRNIANDQRRYRVGVFAVQDTNLRWMLAGIAILADESKETVLTILTSFMQLHGKAPSSILTDDQPTIAHAVEDLTTNEFFTGAHLINCDELLKTIKKNIKCG